MSPPWRRGAALVLLVAILIAPTAAAQMRVDRIDVPARTAAGHVFDARVTLANDGPERTVVLLAALYTAEPGADACGPTTDPRFRTFTHLVQQRVRVPARSVVTHPPDGETWLQRYSTEDAGPQPETAEFCVFVANASQSVRLEYDAFGTTPLSVRALNHAPVPTFTFSPSTPRVSEAVEFQARATDADGDPVTFVWDFGHFVASGKARAEGRVASHAFYPDGEFVVTLTATDGIENATTTQIVRVGADAPRVERMPFPVVLLIIALAAAAFVAPRRGRG